MYAFLLQDWITIRAQSSSVAPIVQSAESWLDLDGYSDVVAWLETKEVTTGGAANVNITYETSATAEDAGFVAMTSAAIALSANTVAVTPMLKDTAFVALARYMRWRLNAIGAASAWDVTFRVWLAANLARRGSAP